MEVSHDEQYSGKSLDHLGLIADTMDSLNLIALIDEHLPLSQTSGVKVTIGERVAAMIYNGLGFVDTRLYMFPEFLHKKPIERLFGKVIDPDWFNDDALGRCLDRIASYGVTKLYTELSLSIGMSQGLLGKSAHFDTSTLQLYGEYPDDSEASLMGSSETGPRPALGYSKSKRHDLKQMVINLATTGAANFPVWMESHSGNASDKTILPQAALKMKQFCEGLSDVPDFLYVGDSAMYSNILQCSEGMKWLSRVPENIKEAKALILKDEKDLSWECLSDGYSYHISQSTYGGVKQRWALIFSKQAYTLEIKTLERNIEKELSSQEKQWWHLSHKRFGCVNDAKIAAHALMKRMKYHLVEFEVTEVMGHSGRGRPSKDAALQHKGFSIEFSIKPDEKKIEQAKIKKGRFILATNELEEEKLANDNLLKEYKAQSGTERAFKFIKNGNFQLDSVFLKTPSRISALMMIMTLCLMVYGVSQHRLRQSLAKTGETIPNQKRKPTNKPSMQWVYYLFNGVHELTIKARDQIKIMVINVTDELKHILTHFGPKARSIYMNTA